MKDEENTVQGIMQRKLSVNFGNRFGGKGYLEGPSAEGQGLGISQQAVAVMEIEAREGVMMSIVTQPGGVAGSAGEKGLGARESLVAVATNESTDMKSSLSSSSSSSSLGNDDVYAWALRSMLEQFCLVLINTNCQHTLSTHTINKHYQHTLSTHTVNTHY